MTTATASPLDTARVRVGELERSLAGIDQRIADAQLIETEQVGVIARHRSARMQAMLADDPLPKEPKLDRDVSERLAVLRGHRTRLESDLAIAKSKVRGLMVEHVQARLRAAMLAYGTEAAALVAGWTEIVSLDHILQSAGVRSIVPDVFLQLEIPTIGNMRGIAPEMSHIFFVASHRVAQGMSAEVYALRQEIECELGEKLPW